jgi:hypothetical protein
MSSEHPEEFSKPPVGRAPQTSDDRRESETAGDHGPSDDAKRHETTVVVRGETVRDQAPKSPSRESPPKDNEKSPRKEVSEAKTKMQSRLPVLDDDPDLRVQQRTNCHQRGQSGSSIHRNSARLRSAAFGTQGAVAGISDL